MSTVYTINFTDPTLVGKSTFTIAPGDHDGPDQLETLPPTPSKAHTSLTLFGQGALKYGQMINEDFVHILENFASNGIEPIEPTVGQLWFDAAASALKIYTTAQQWVVSPGNVVSFSFPLLAAQQLPTPKFFVQGNHIGAFGVGITFAIGSDIVAPANNGTYTVVTSAYNPGTDRTEITVATVPTVQGLPSGNVQTSQQPGSPQIGQLWYDFGSTPPVLKVWNGLEFVPIVTAEGFDTTLNMGGNNIINLGDATYNITAPVTTLAPGVNYWTIVGDQTANILPGQSVIVYNNSGTGNGVYTVVSSTLVLGNTRIVVVESIPGAATADGLLSPGQGALNAETADMIYVRRDGTYAMTGILNLGTHKISNVVDPTPGTQEAATANYALARAGTDAGMTGNLVMNSHLIRSVTNPLLAQDAATKFYVDTAVSPPGTGGAAYVFTGSGSPYTIITPTKAGDTYIDTTTPAIWVSVTALNTGWRQVWPALYA